MTDRQFVGMGAGILVAAMAGALFLPVLLVPTRTRCGPRPDGSLKTIVTAQADFRAHDRDGNGKHDYWRGDIAGLCTLIPKGSEPVPTNAIKLIEPSVALADDRPLSDPELGLGRRGPKAGYWYRAIGHAGEKEPNPNRFAACAFPADYPQSGRVTFIVDEGYTIYKRDLGRPGGVDVFPDAETLGREWTRLD